MYNWRLYDRSNRNRQFLLERWRAGKRGLSHPDTYIMPLRRERNKFDFSIARVSLGSPRCLLGRTGRAGGVYGNCGSCSLIISDVIYLDHGCGCAVAGESPRALQYGRRASAATPFCWSLSRGRIVTSPTSTSG